MEDESDCLRLKPLSWFVARADDRNAVRKFPKNFFANIGSAQNCYFPAGFTVENIALLARFSALRKRFPTVQEARQIFDSLKPSLKTYQFRQDGDTWWISCEHLVRFDDPLANDPWDLYWPVGDQVQGLAFAAGELVEAMELMPLLNGNHGRQFVESAMADNIPGRKLLEAFLATGALESLPRRKPPASWPEFLFLGHSSLVLSTERSCVVVDPVLRPANERLDDEDSRFFAAIERADMILISHNHWDHFDFQTLVRIDRDKRFVVPRCTRPTPMNPPLASYLKSLGFTAVEEHAPGAHLVAGDIELDLYPFYGESFGLDSVFDAFTFLASFNGYTLYSTIDACLDERGDMTETIQKVGQAADIDLFLFGASGQTHETPWGAARVRHFSNELKDWPALIRYHPTYSDIADWVSVLKPQCLIPYAEFIFGGTRATDIVDGELKELAGQLATTARIAQTEPVFRQWIDDACSLGEQTGLPVLLLQPMQGLHTSILGQR